MKNKAVINVLIILCCSILAKVLSYIWEALLAANLGTSYEADALYTTIGIFTILYPILDFGIWKVFLPVYKTKLVNESSDEADKLSNIAQSFFLLISIGLVLMIVIFAKPIVSIVSPGFSNELKLITIKYLKLSAPMYLLMASASVIGAILQCHNKFLGSQIREVGTHVSKIFVFLLCFKSLGIYAAILAQIIGSVFRLLIQLPFIDWKWKFRFDFDFSNENIKIILKGLPSVSLTAAINQINALVDKMLASSAVTGAISCLNYGNKLMNIFSGMITNAIGIAVYPTVVQYVAQKDTDKLKRLLQQSICISAYIIIPLNIFCLLFSTPIVKVAFERGAFDVMATQMTSQVFSAYTVGMFFIGLTTIISNVFYAYGDTKITMNISIIDIILNIILNNLYLKILGVAGLALATSTSAIICFIIRVVCLRKYIVLQLRDLNVEIGKILFLSVISCSFSFLIYHSIDFNYTLNLIISILIVIILYLAGSLLFRIDSFMYCFKILKSKMKR